MCLFILRRPITNIIVIVAARINVKISGQSLRKTGYFHSLRYLPQDSYQLQGKITVTLKKASSYLLNQMI